MLGEEGLASALYFLKYFEKNALYFGVLSEEQVSVLAILDQTQKLNEQLLFVLSKVFLAQIIQHQLQLQHRTFTARAADHQHVEVGVYMGRWVITDPPVLELVLL